MRLFLFALGGKNTAHGPLETPTPTWGFPYQAVGISEDQNFKYTPLPATFFFFSLNAPALNPSRDSGKRNQKLRAIEQPSGKQKENSQLSTIELLKSN